MQVDRRLRSQYRRSLMDLQLVIAGELAGIDDDIFQPSKAIVGCAVEVIQFNNQLKGCLEVKDDA